MIHTAASLDFGGQPFFTLACVGIPDTSGLQGDIDQLKQRHKLLGGELKSSALSSKPGVFLELVGMVRERGWPWFIEVVDKRYALCTNLVTWQLLPPLYDMAESAESRFVRNMMADCLFAHAPSEVFALFLEACRSPAEDSLRRSLQALARMPMLNRMSRDVALAIRQSAAQSLTDFEELRVQATDAHKRFLPSSDDNKRGLPVWMLPNLGSLTHIYARINQFCKRDLKSMRLVHDEQHHFDSILAAAKHQAETLSARAAKIYVPHADFNFMGAAEMVFARSDDHVGLQVADVLAGCVMRYMRDWAAGQAIELPVRQAFEALLEMCDPDRAVGLNFVIPTPMHAALVG